MKTHAQIVEQFNKYVMANYRRVPITVVRGAGSFIEDANGKKYLDLFPGWGVAALGHCHPRIVAAVQKQAEKLLHVANTYYCEEQGEFAEMLSTRADGQQCFFCNSGAEAAEGALKLARLAQVPKYGIITFNDSFHGRTFAAISATGQPAYRRGFEPTVPGFTHATLNDLNSVKNLIDENTAAIMLELVQGESGVRAVTPEFIRGLRALCDEKKILLIFDEVQTAPARLGKWFGYQVFGVKPDILTSAKAIAGGLPLGVFMADKKIAQYLKPGTHASTFGGNALGCAAGIAALKTIEDENLFVNIATLGKILDTQVNEWRQQTDNIKDYRRVGLMIALELAPTLSGASIVNACAERGVLLNCTHETILRMLPAFNLAASDWEMGLTTLKNALVK